MPTIIGYDKSVKLRCTCRKCGAIVEYLPKDVKSATVCDYSGGRDVVYYITCPGCGEDINNVERYK